MSNSLHSPHVAPQTVDHLFQTDFSQSFTTIPNFNDGYYARENANLNMEMQNNFINGNQGQGLANMFVGMPGVPNGQFQVGMYPNMGQMPFMPQPFMNSLISMPNIQNMPSMLPSASMLPHGVPSLGQVNPIMLMNQPLSVPSAEANDEPVYVNSKQFNRIMYRRQQRQKNLAKKNPNSKGYAQESRMVHANKRIRDKSGRFLNKTEAEQNKSNSTAMSFDPLSLLPKTGYLSNQASLNGASLMANSVGAGANSFDLQYNSFPAASSSVHS